MRLLGNCGVAMVSGGLLGFATVGRVPVVTKVLLCGLLG